MATFARGIKNRFVMERNNSGIRWLYQNYYVYLLTLNRYCIVVNNSTSTVDTSMMVNALSYFF